VSAPAPSKAEAIESRILFVRGQRVMLDTDLARLYGVPTKRLNEQIRRNIDASPVTSRSASPALSGSL
jgi:hypothetical protein